MAAEVIILQGFTRVLIVITVFAAATKMFLLSRDSTWDGWNLMVISLAFLSIGSLLTLLEGFGINLIQVKAAASAAAGAIAALAFIMARRSIRVERKRRG